MKSNLLLISLLVASPAFAASFAEPAKGTTTTDPKKTTAPVVTAPVVAKPVETKLPPLVLGPQVTGLFRIVKPDGSTVIAQTAVTVGNTASVNVINVATTDAFQAGNGKCAFNVKYDEVSGLAVTGTTNRLFSNDTLVAQNTKVDLVANVLKSIVTQPYLVPGQNTIKLMINADSASPSIGWVRVNVSGTCGATPVKEVPKEVPKTTTPPTTGTPVTPPPKEAPKEPPKVTPAPVTAAKPVAPVAPVVTRFAPGSAQWNNLTNAFGYSNYGVTMLKGNKTFTRYADLVKLNAEITVFINAKLIDEASFNALMARWNSFVLDESFKKAMLAVVPAGDKK